jgi:Skp family chaperone for outer membrane proteins
MRVSNRWIVGLVVAALATPVAAGNVGFLDTDRAIRTVKEGQRQLQILDQWANQRADDVEALQARVNELTEQLDAQRAVASPEAVWRLEDELRQAQRDLEDASRTVQRDFAAKQKELLSQVATRVRDIAGEYAEANGFDAIFPFESQPLVYVAESSIITEAVIRLYDERYPVD